jgi:small GTP-binding protein
MAHEYSLKIIMVGDSQVGKTALIKRIINDKFTTRQQTIISHDVELKKHVNTNDKNIEMTFVDVSSKEKLQIAKSTTYNNCSVAIVAFDLTSIESFSSIPFWLEYAKKNTKLDFVILVGTKSDMEEQRCVENETIVNLCKNHENYNIKYIETSAKKKINVKELEDLIVNSASMYKMDTVTKDESKHTYSTFENMSETITLIPHNRMSRKRKILQKFLFCMGDKTF